MVSTKIRDQLDQMHSLLCLLSAVRFAELCDLGARGVHETLAVLIDGIEKIKTDLTE